MDIAPFPFNAFGLGPELDRLASACIPSFVEMGHPVMLYAHDALSGVPPGVTVADAAQILPRDSVVIQKRTGSVALFSDRFRYEVLSLDRGGWIDCDLLCLRPIEPWPYIFGWEEDGLVNGAILRLPPRSEMLAELRRIFETKRWTPPWHSRRKRLQHRWLSAGLADGRCLDRMSGMPAGVKSAMATGCHTGVFRHNPAPNPLGR